MAASRACRADGTLSHGRIDGAGRAKDRACRHCWGEAVQLSALSKLPRFGAGFRDLNGGCLASTGPRAALPN
jgi:hypothetical protein